MSTIKDRQEFVYASSVLQGDYDVSVHCKRARRQRRLFTKILDKYMDVGIVTDYRISKGKPVTDGHGTHGTGVRIMVDFFSGMKSILTRTPEYKPTDHVVLPQLPKYVDHNIDHEYQGSKIPFSYTMVERAMHDKREQDRYRADVTDTEYSISGPDPEPVAEHQRPLTIDDMEDIF